MKRFLGIANMIVVHKQSIISEMDVTLHYEVFTLLTLFKQKGYYAYTHIAIWVLEQKAGRRVENLQNAHLNIRILWSALALGDG